MSRRLMLGARTALAVAAIPLLGAGPAEAHIRYNACVVAKYDTRLREDFCDYHCWRKVRWGRAFRVIGEDGRYLLVRNLSMKGWMKIYSLRLARQAYCRAAGI